MRYYYTDPLAAAYMAKHYCMKFRDNDGETLESDRDVLVGNYDGGYYDPVEGNIEVHPDSLHLLEPQVGDAVEFDRWFWDRQRFHEYKDYPYHAHYGRVGAYGRNDEYLGISSCGVGWDNTDADSPRFTLPFKIIQRNGKPFFWPEVKHD